MPRYPVEQQGGEPLLKEDGGSSEQMALLFNNYGQFYRNEFLGPDHSFRCLDFPQFSLAQVLFWPD